MRQHNHSHDTVRRLIGLATFALTLFALIAPATRSIAAEASSKDAAQRPNIIFIFTDDHAPHAIGAYQKYLDFGEQLEGHTPTPHIDKLAEQGMVFANAFVTNSICKPSRAVILSGKHSHLNGVPTNRQSIDTELRTFPKLLQKADYQTAIFGKWHLGTEPQGFDHYEVLYGQGPYYNPPLRTPEGRVEHTGYTTDVITDRTLNWIKKQRDGAEPFMVMFQHKAPHRNWMPGPENINKYDDVTLPEPKSLFYDYSGLTDAATMQKMEIATHARWGWDLKLPRNPDNPDQPANGYNRFAKRFNDDQRRMWEQAYRPENEAFYKRYEQGMSDKEEAKWRYQRYMKDYLRSIKAVDDNIGRVMDYLDKAGLKENTVVIYCSDQGFFLGENGWFDKRWMYEESLRMPLVVRWPGVIEPGSANHKLVQNLDLAQTFLDMAGVDAPDDMQGRSLVPLMKGNHAGEWRDSIYYHYYEHPGAHSVRRHYGVRTERYKLIHFYNLDQWEMFDLKKDPRELNSVYGDPDYADVQKRLKKELKRLQTRYGDTDPEQSVSAITLRRKLDEIKNVKLKKVLHLKSADGDAPQGLDPSLKPLTVGAWATPEAKDGAIIARGGVSLGYMLSLKDGRPAFAIRNGGTLKRVVADKPVDLGEPVHLVGMLDKEQTLHLYVNGKHAAKADGHYISRNPSDGLAIGADAGSQVGDQSGEIPFRGDLRDIRVYWGVLGGDEIKQWAKR